MGARGAGAAALCCRVYVTEGRSVEVLGRLEAAARGAPGCALAHVHRDPEYHRTGFTLAAGLRDDLAGGAVRLARAALAELRRGGRASEVASHPRLGAVDHISFHAVPVPGTGGKCGEGAAKAAEVAAREAATALGEGPLAVPVHLYGGCHPRGRTLAALRRELGYFTGRECGDSGGVSVGGASSDPEWEGSFSRYAGLTPDFGPDLPPGDLGVMCVGAVPWLVNYNVTLETADLAVGRSVARAVSSRGGGLPGVQAMALRHGEGLEVACNLTDPERAGPAEVLRRVRGLADEAGVAVGAAYSIGPGPEELLALVDPNRHR